MNDHFAGGTFLSTFGPGLAILIVGALIIRGVLNFLRGYSTPTERYLADLGRRRAGEIEVVNAEPVSIPRVPRGWMGSNYPPRPGTSGGCIGDDLPPSPDRYTAERMSRRPAKGRMSGAVTIAGRGVAPDTSRKARIFPSRPSTSTGRSAS